MTSNGHWRRETNLECIEEQEQEKEEWHSGDRKGNTVVVVVGYGVRHL
jgi:hypothetical protein